MFKQFTRTLAPIALLIVAVILVGCASPTLATVNGETITAKEFQDRYRFEVLVLTGGQGLESAVETENAAQLILDIMIGEKIVHQKAAELDLTVSSSEYQTALAEFENLEELINLIVENTDLSEELVREMWKTQIEGRILLNKLAEHHGRPAADLVDEWVAESDVEYNDDWKAFIPAN